MITLTTELTKEGVVCSHSVLGKVATIMPATSEAKVSNSWAGQDGKWFVFPYVFPAYERGARFHSLKAAEAYALALAYEMQEIRQ